jgi:hypothetical protein
MYLSNHSGTTVVAACTVSVTNITLAALGTVNGIYNDVVLQRIIVFVNYPTFVGQIIVIRRAIILDYLYRRKTIQQI